MTVEVKKRTDKLKVFWVLCVALSYLCKNQRALTALADINLYFSTDLVLQEQAGVWTFL